jgi:transcriptional regulator with XRE-family HTH domain
LKTLTEFAVAIRARMKEAGLTQAELADAAGISRRTLTQLLNGSSDFRMGTLLAIADRLKLEVLMVPQAITAAIGPGSAVTEPVVKTRVQAALDRVRGTD